MKETAADAGKSGFMGLTPALVLICTCMLLAVLAGGFSDVPISVAFWRHRFTD